MQATFVSSLTQLIVGCGINASARQLVVIWTTASKTVPDTVYVHMDHIVPLLHSVVSTDSRTSPTFVGPMYLHWDGKYQTYVDIFTDLRAALEGSVHSTELRVSKNVVVGSDEEKAFTKALRKLCKVFREAAAVRKTPQG